MEQESCFICGVKIGRGNRTEVGSQEKMEKLISVSNTVEHSSTIISDILSRILNETVMREEIVCRICYNLLNDVDYHLKEAQEKTDEITAKFLDKEKDPLQYHPSKLLDPRNTSALEIKTHHRNISSTKGVGEHRKKEKKSHGKLVTTTGIRPDSRYFQSEIDYNPIIHRKGNHHKVSPNHNIQLAHPVTTPYPQTSANPRLATVHSPPPDSEVGASSADEMTVNALAEKKRRLISRVLAPGKRSKHDPRLDEEDDFYNADDLAGDSIEPTYEELTIDSDREREEFRDSEKRRKKERKKRKKEKERRERREREEVRRQDVHVIRLNQENSDNEELKENTSPHRNKEIRTVDLAQLGHLFSSTQDDKGVQLVSRKAVPTPAERKQMDYNHTQTYYILPDSSKQHSIELGEITMGQVIAEADPLGGDVTVVSKEHMSLEMQAGEGDIDNDDDIHEISVLSTPGPSHHTVYTTQTQVTASDIKVVAHTPQKSTSSIATTPSTPSIPCPHCDKKFMRGHNMRVHINRVHNKFKPWKCQFCEKTFATTSDLKQHMSSHGMGKIHKCADCGRQFNNRDSAILHRKQHNNERTHICSECGKGFYKASCLSRHLRCHTGEKPFQCEFCQRNFAQVATLKQHKKVCKYCTTSIEEKGETVQQIE